ncbi:hypothetical protein [Streptomyces sp. NPDC053079]|uniref:hypothetical protein n=1 Tax=Streptomyces sp. NPDC053079 TaxID=3365697 RepID=UPI0037D1F49C
MIPTSSFHAFSLEPFPEIEGNASITDATPGILTDQDTALEPGDSSRPRSSCCSPPLAHPAPVAPPATIDGPDTYWEPLWTRGTGYRPLREPEITTLAITASAEVQLLLALLQQGVADW